MRGLINLERVRSKFPYSLPRLFPDKNPVFILFMTIKSISQTRRPRRTDYSERRSKFTWKHQFELGNSFIDLETHELFRSQLSIVKSVFIFKAKY